MRASKLAAVLLLACSVIMPLHANEKMTLSESFDLLELMVSRLQSRLSGSTQRTIVLERHLQEAQRALERLDEQLAAASRSQQISERELKTLKSRLNKLDSSLGQSEQLSKQVRRERNLWRSRARRRLVIAGGIPAMYLLVRGIQAIVQ